MKLTTEQQLKDTREDLKRARALLDAKTQEAAYWQNRSETLLRLLKAVQPGVRLAASGKADVA